MATLIKASTARNRASKVDKFALYLEHIALHISDAAGRGEYDIDLYFPEDYVDYLKGELHAAGYEVALMPAMYRNVFCSAPLKKSLWRKMLDMVSPPPASPQEEGSYCGGYNGTWNVSWQYPLAGTDKTSKA